MKAEQIHEALNLLPEDLIGKVDRLRTGYTAPVRRSWRNLVAAAACVALLLLGTFAWQLSGIGSRGTEALSTAANPESAEENLSRQEPAENDSLFSDSTAELEDGLTGSVLDTYPVSAQCIRSETAVLSADHPPIQLFRSRQELEDYCETHDTAQILGMAASYDEIFFSENDLLLVDLGQGSSSIRHQIHTLAPTGDHAWELQGTQTVPDAVTLDMVQWFSLAQVPKDLIQPGDTLTLNLETVKE